MKDFFTLGSLIHAILTLGVTPSALLAQETAWDIQTTVGASFSWGSADEIVYKSAATDAKESLLIWDIPAALGPKISVSLQSPFLWFIASDLAFFLPLTTGLMTNSDWVGIPDTQISNEYSESQNFLTSFFTARIETGARMDFDWFSASLGAEASFLHLSWEGWNTKHIRTAISGYPPNSFTYGQAIDYRQTWFLPGLVGRIAYQNDWFNLDVSGTYYPGLAFQARDIHIYRELTFLDSGTGGSGWAFRMNAAYFFSTEWGVRAHWEISSFKTGHVDTIIASNGSQVESTAYALNPGGAGGALSQSSLTLGLVISLD